MACGCSDDVCACELNSSNTISITGSGQSGDPYFASVIPAPSGGLQNVALGVSILLDPDACNILTLSTAGLLGLVHVESSPSVTFSGCGTEASPITATVVTGGDSGLANAEPGDIWMTGANTAGSGWVLCDGTVYDAVADPNFLPLFTAIGVKFGGTGADDFSVPNMNGRSPMGAGIGAGEDASGEQGTTPTGSALANRDVGDWLGSQTHLLLPAEMPSHTHTGPSHSHVMTHQHGATSTEEINAAWNDTPVEDYGNPGGDIGTAFSGTGGERQIVSGRTAGTGGNGTGNDFIQGGDHQHSTAEFAGSTDPAGTGATGSAGGDTPHQTIHPVLAVNFKIKL